MRYLSLFVSFCFFTTTIPGCQSLSDSPEVSALGEDLWGEAGGLAYVQAANRMIKNHPDWEYLSERDQKALSMVFGDLPGKVFVHWNAIPLNEWASDKYGIEVVGEDAEAQTYGFHIYMKGAKSAWTDDHRLETLIHEITHTYQFQQYNESLTDYGNVYFREYFIAGQDYMTNKLEVEARNKADVWISAVLSEYKKSQ